MSGPELYRPSNGSEGDWFVSSWCGNCARDRAMSEGIDAGECEDHERCEIIARAMAFDIYEAGYPQEWIYGERGPCCTAFIPRGDEIKHRCTRTVDMFNAT